MTVDTRQRISVVIGLIIIAASILGGIWLVRAIWTAFVSLDSDLATGIIAGSTTVLVAVITIVLGRYFERKKEVEVHFRAQKTEMYDEFLKKFFELFHNDQEKSVDLVPFLRDWQRKMIVWGGAPVLKAFIKWRKNMAKSEPDAQTVFLMEDFFRAIRRDLGLSNVGLEKGSFSSFILRNNDLFMQMAKANPAVTLTELARREKELGLK